MTTELKQNLKRRETWLRLLLVVLFWLIYSVAEFVLAAVVLLQFGFKLITGECNQKLLHFGASLSQFIYQVVKFMTFNTDERPFPFADWPSHQAGGDGQESSPSS